MRGEDGHVNVTFCHADFFAGLLTLFFHRRMAALLSQQLSRVDCQSTTGRNEGSYEAEQEHRDKHSSEDQRIAWGCVGDEVRHQTAGEDPEDQTQGGANEKQHRGSAKSGAHDLDVLRAEGDADALFFHAF
jgi:hypothetical protein